MDRTDGAPTPMGAFRKNSLYGLSGAAVPARPRPPNTGTKRLSARKFANARSLPALTPLRPQTDLRDGPEREGVQQFADVLQRHPPEQGNVFGNRPVLVAVNPVVAEGR